MNIRFILFISLLCMEQCQAVPIEKWKDKSDLTDDDIRILKVIRDGDLKEILNLMDDNIYLYMRNSYELKKKDFSKDFLNRKGILYQALFDVKALQDNYQINKDMISIRESIQFAGKLYISNNDRVLNRIDQDEMIKIRGIDITNKNTFYHIGLTCKYNYHCNKIKSIAFSNESGVINAPMTEAEKRIVQLLRESNHIEFMKYFEDRVSFDADIPDVGGTDFVKNIDGKEFINKKNNYYKILFDKNDPYSFYNRFTEVENLEVVEEEKDGLIYKTIYVIGVKRFSIQLKIHLRYKKGEPPRIYWFSIV